MSSIERMHRKGVARKGRAVGAVALTGVVIFAGIELVLLVAGFVAKIVTIALPLMLVLGILFVAYKLFLESEREDE